jgi:Subtilase family
MAERRVRTRRRAAAIPTPTDRLGRLSVLIELRPQSGASGAFAMAATRGIEVPGFTLDESFEPVSLTLRGDGMSMAGGETYVVRGTVKDEKEFQRLRARPEVAGVWPDTPIAPFPGPRDRSPANVVPVPSPAAGACPIPPCDCDPATPKGTIADVATYLGVDRIWSTGVRGAGMVVGVVDGGITALGRPVKAGETTRRISRVIGGWPTADWGTEASKWNEHGNMCSTDVLGMAPDAQIYDLRVSGTGGSPGTISRALQAFSWAISQHRTNGTPQVLTNSWGIFQESWDPTYARDPNHPFTRKVVEAINEGILVLFAAGNCGDTCPDGRCGPDIGPGKSIWGANGHPMVMTVGAVNKNEQFIGYSSRGPAALDPNKPDFCSISHFAGYFTSDSGTSAATPVLAGVVALFKQAKPAATQDQIKNALKATAKDIGPAGFDQHSGAGIVQGHAAYLHLARPRPTLTCPPPRTLAPPCPPRTLVPPCPRPTLTCPPPRTLAPPCPPRTLVPPCPRPTLTCPPPRTLAPPCPPRTLVPPCPPRTLAPPCPPRTLAPPCPRPTLTCPRPSLACGVSPGGFEYDPWAWTPYGGWYGTGAESGYPAEYGYAEPGYEYGYAAPGYEYGYAEPGYDWSQSYGEGWNAPYEYWYDEGSGWDPGQG